MIVSAFVHLPINNHALLPNMAYDLHILSDDRESYQRTTLTPLQQQEHSLQMRRLVDGIEDGLLVCLVFWKPLFPYSHVVYMYCYEKYFAHAT